MYAKIGSCQEFFLCKKDYYYPNNSSFFYPKTPIPSHTTYTWIGDIMLKRKIKSIIIITIIVLLSSLDLISAKTLPLLGIVITIDPGHGDG